jgi:SAM-dependent methyltransferase
MRNFLKDPRLEGVDVDSDDLLNIHHQILLEKRMMHDVFSEFYQTCIKLDNKYFSGNGLRVEIGAGVSFFKKQHPEIISTDIKAAENLDKVINALDMDFEDLSVRAIYGINCFHHFPDPDKFFQELNRVLVKGGGCVLIEPYYGFLGKRFFKKLFDTETFDMSQKDWKNPENQVMTGANQALSYVVFKRDYEKFAAMYPSLSIVYHSPIKNYPRYLLSGGLNFRSLLPGWTSPALKIFEFCISPLKRLFGLHHVIVIRKSNN